MKLARRAKIRRHPFAMLILLVFFLSPTVSVIAASTDLQPYLPTEADVAAAFPMFRIESKGARTFSWATTVEFVLWDDLRESGDWRAFLHASLTELDSIALRSHRDMILRDIQKGRFTLTEYEGTFLNVIEEAKIGELASFGKLVRGYDDNRLISIESEIAFIKGDVYAETSFHAQLVSPYQDMNYNMYLAAFEQVTRSIAARLPTQTTSTTSTTERGGLVVTIALGVDMQLDNRENYTVGETLYVKIIVKDSWMDKGVSSAHLTERWTHEDSGKSSEFEDYTDAYGAFVSHTLLTRDYVGSWMIAVAASAEGYPDEATSYRTFTVTQRPPVAIELFADKQKDERGVYVYEPGERVVLSGRILKLLESGQYLEYGASKPFTVMFEFPGNTEPLKFARSVVSDDDGTFRFSPFATYEIGSYTITAEITDRQKQTFPELSGYQGPLPSSTVTLVVESENMLDMGQVKQQLEEIIRIYRNEKSLYHRDEVIKKWKLSVSDRPHVNPALGTTDPDEVNPHLWGIINNEQYGAENPFSCANYRNEVLKLLNRIRFSEDPETRALLRGIDYGPIMRGFMSGSLIAGEHHAVALYDRSSGGVFGWPVPTDSSPSGYVLVLDPWPTQTPEVYTLEEFRSFYKLDMFAFLDLGRRRVVPDPEMRDAANPDWQQWFPNLDGVVYWNLQWVPHLPGQPPGWGKKVEHTTTAIGGHSPITFCVTNDAGERVGVLEDGTLVAEIEGSQLYIYPESSTELFWYIGLPDGNYDLRMTGIADGNFDVGITGTDRVLYYYTAPISKNEVATLEVDTGTLGGEMTLPSGEKVSPTAIPVGGGTTTDHGELVAAIALGSDFVFDNTESYVLGQTVQVKVSFTDSLTGKGVPNVEFHCSLHNSESDTILDYWDTADANGEWTVEIELANESYLGTWSFEVNEVSAEAYENWRMAEDTPSGFTVVSEGGNVMSTTTDMTMDWTTTGTDGDGGGGSYLAGLIVLVLAVAAVLYVRRRASARKLSTTPPTVPPAAAVAYCENCGRQFPEGTMYCPSCGDKQGE